MIKDFIVIGAGMSGLSIARKIKDHELGSVWSAVVF
jgi:cation diffusion facilitator CzcD-associated flavoprotein CzcO